MMPPPHIVLLQADDLSRSVLFESHLSSVIHTPRLDRFASEGVRFTRSFVTNSLCAPSRTTTLTGLGAHEHGVISVGHSAQSNGQCKTCTGTFRMPAAIESYPELLRRHGYSTAQFGKYHSHDVSFGARAFEHFRPLQRTVYRDPAYCSGWPAACRPERRRRDYESNASNALAVSWLSPWLDGTRENRPFYVEIDYFATHEPFDCGPAERALYEGKLDFPEPASLYAIWGDAPNSTAAVRHAHKVAAQRHVGLLDATYGWTPEFQCRGCVASRRVRKLGGDIARQFRLSIHDRTSRLRAIYQALVQEYARSVATLDRLVGEALDAIDVIRDDAIVFFISDQGYFLGEHGRVDKRLMYDDALYYPLLVRYPPLLEPGSIVDDVVTNLDLAPTVLRLAGVEPPPHLLGRPLFPSSPTLNRTVYYRYASHSDAVPAHLGVRTLRYKLIFWYSHDCTRLRASTAVNDAIRYPALGSLRPLADLDARLVPGLDTSWELFDLDRDPLELHNLFHQPSMAKVRCDLLRTLYRAKHEARDDDRVHCPEALRPERHLWTRSGIATIADLCGGGGGAG